jgi:transitional endoplasmic reticulum ATPase
MNMSMSSMATIAVYVVALMDAFPPDSPLGGKLGAWLQDRPVPAQLALPARDQPFSACAWQSLRQAWAEAAAQAAATDPVAANVAVFARAIKLDALETAIFHFVLLTDLETSFGVLCNDLVASRRVDGLGLLAAAVRRPVAEVRDRLEIGTLDALELVCGADDGAVWFTMYIKRRIRDALRAPLAGPGEIERRLIGEPLTAQLESGDYDFVARERDFVISLLRGALMQRRKGINVLLYGPPGTGKTEFCKMVARAVGADLFAVGEADALGNEPERSERVDALRLAERIAGQRGNTVFLFDEMEDLQQQGERSAAGRRRVRRAGSKVFFNRILERNCVPVLWTANSIGEFDPAFLRRMSFAVEFRIPPATQRARMWSSHAREQALDLPESEAFRLAKVHSVAPSTMASAVQAIATAQAAPSEIDFVVEALSRPLDSAARAPVVQPHTLVPELVNADADLDQLVNVLARPGAPRDFSLCLYGPPGTGKSAFARRLAVAMRLDLSIKRGSDLLSMWVGGTERAIAATFEEARRDERFLVIDEAEAFLWSRGGASRSWEVSMVNELLIAIEAHPLPLACTTNHLDFVDPAALRRFTFKIKFDYLTRAQTAAAFRRFFMRTPPPSLGQIEALTPGDFAAVAKKLRFYDADALGDTDILRMLEQEAAVKNVGRRIGF